MRGEGPMIIEIQANKAKNREMAMCRMWHYIDNTAFIIKQKGCKEEILSLVFELENLLSVTYLAKEQVERLLDAHKADRNIVELQDTILIAEKTEAILGAEWNIRKNVQVNHIQYYYANLNNFRKMSNFEAKLSVIGSYTGDIQNFLAEILRDNSKRNTDNARRFLSSLKLVAYKAKTEMNNARSIVQSIEKNSPDPRSIDELYSDLTDIIAEVSPCKKMEFRLKNTIFNTFFPLKKLDFYPYLFVLNNPFYRSPILSMRNRMILLRTSTQTAPLRLFPLPLNWRQERNSEFNYIDKEKSVALPSLLFYHFYDYYSYNVEVTLKCYIPHIFSKIIDFLTSKIIPKLISKLFYSAKQNYFIYFNFDYSLSVSHFFLKKKSCRFYTSIIKIVKITKKAQNQKIEKKIIFYFSYKL